MNDKTILMVLIEPTPYLIDLVNQLKIQSSWKIDVLFLSLCITQNWDLSLHEDFFILPKNKKSIIKSIYQYIIKKKYQLIFFAGWSNAIILTMMFLAKLKKIPIAVDSDTPLAPHTSFVKRIIKRIIYPILFKLPTIFLPAGTRQAAYLKHYGAPHHKIIIEKMTVDVQSIQSYIQQLSSKSRNRLRQQIRFNENDFVFLFIGRLIDRKGIIELLDAFSKINSANAKLLVIGDGPLRAMVEKFSEKNNHIHYGGWLEKESIINMYFISDVFILPAHWEPWGLVINEAMAAGKPVITTDQVGCVDDLVIPYKTGLVTKSNCADDLTAAMLYFINNPENAINMSQHALEHISSWTLENEAKQILLGWSQALQTSR